MLSDVGCFFKCAADIEMYKIAVVVQGCCQVKWKANMSVRAISGQLGWWSDTLGVWAMGRLGQGTGVLADGIARDTQLACPASIILAGALPQNKCC